MTTSICIAQLNFVVGDFSGNAQKIIEAAKQAHTQGASLLVTPELALCGYAAEDLLLRPSFQQASDEALQSIIAATADLPGLALLLGHTSGGVGYFAPSQHSKLDCQWPHRVQLCQTGAAELWCV